MIDPTNFNWFHFCSTSAATVTILLFIYTTDERYCHWNRKSGILINDYVEPIVEFVLFIRKIISIELLYQTLDETWQVIKLLSSAIDHLSTMHTRNEQNCKKCPIHLQCVITSLLYLHFAIDMQTVPRIDGTYKILNIYAGLIQRQSQLHQWQLKIDRGRKLREHQRITKISK